MTNFNLPRVAKQSLFSLKELNKNKQHIKYLFFTLNNFTVANFLKEVKNIFSNYKTYTINIKLSFSNGSDYRMATFPPRS